MTASQEQPFKPEEVDFLTYMEQCWALNGALPTHDMCEKTLGISRARYERLWSDVRVQAYLEERGIPVQRYLNGQSAPDVLSPLQLRTINTLLDFNDTRPDHKKLKDLGVGSAKFQAWKKDPVFAAYLRQRGENLFGENLDEVHRAVLDSARSGDLNAAKTIYKITGYFDDQQNVIDANALITSILEILQKRINDPALLGAISQDMLALSQQVNRARPILEMPAITTSGF